MDQAIIGLPQKTLTFLARNALTATASRNHRDLQAAPRRFTQRITWSCSPLVKRGNIGRLMASA